MVCRLEWTRVNKGTLWLLWLAHHCSMLWCFKVFDFMHPRFGVSPASIWDLCDCIVKIQQLRSQYLPVAFHLLIIIIINKHNSTGFKEDIELWGLILVLCCKGSVKRHCTLRCNTVLPGFYKFLYGGVEWLPQLQLWHFHWWSHL